MSGRVALLACPAAPTYHTDPLPVADGPLQLGLRRLTVLLVQAGQVVVPLMDARYLARGVSVTNTSAKLLSLQNAITSAMQASPWG